MREEPPPARAKRVRKHFQKTVRKALDSKIQVKAGSRMRWKLDRWNLCGFPGITAERYLRALEVVKAWLPPRVGAASLRTAWNGWCTRRRFQQYGPCLFSCGSFLQEDSIEHYACCRTCVSFLRKRLHFQGPIDRGHLVVLGTNHRGQSQEDIMRLGLWVYVLYRTFNYLRKSQQHLGQTDMGGLLEQFLRDAISGHDGASRFVRNCWDQRYRHQSSQP